MVHVGCTQLKFEFFKKKYTGMMPEFLRIDPIFGVKKLIKGWYENRQKTVFFINMIPEQ